MNILLIDHYWKKKYNSSFPTDYTLQIGFSVLDSATFLHTLSS